MWILEVVVGIGGGFFLQWLGVPSLVPVLLFMPFFSFATWPILLGVVSVVGVDLAAHSTGALHHPLLLSLVFAGAGILLFPFLEPFLSVFEFLLPVAIGGVLLLLSRVQFSRGWKSVLFLWLLVCVGYFLFVRWAIPLSLSAWLAGFMGWSAQEPLPAPTSSHPVVSGVAGVLLGILPGLGPGLIGIVWSAARSAPLLVSTNLLFSFGFLSLSGKVRSVPAAALSSFHLPDWPFVLALVGIGMGLAVLIRPAPARALIPPFGWDFLGLAFLVLIGGGPTLLVWILARSLSFWSTYFRVPLSLGLVVLLPPIVLFYL